MEWLWNGCGWAVNSGAITRSHRVSLSLCFLEVHIFVDAVIAMDEPVKIHFLWGPQLRDPGDEMVLEAAVN